MAKNGKKKKTKGSNDGSLTAAREVLVATAADVVGRALTGLAGEGIGLLTPSSKDESGKISLSGDPAAKVLRVLAEEEPLGIAELLEQTGAGLSELLHALRDARDFRLVEFDENAEAVHLTETGRRVARNVKKGGIRETAGRLLGR